MKRFTIALLLSFIAAGMLQTVVWAQSTRSVLDGVYTKDQAGRGEALYVKSCGICHGDAVPGPYGTSMGPSLVGDEFLANYNGGTAGDLFSKIRQTMPGDNPGSLQPQETVDLLAFMFSASRWPDGGTELPPDLATLKQIRIQP